MQFVALFLAILILVTGCSSAEKSGSIEDLPPLLNDVVEAPDEVVYVRLSEALSACYGNSPDVRIYENKRDTFQVIGLITDDLSLGYVALIKATVSSGPSGTTRLSYSWQNHFWEPHALKFQKWARGDLDC